MRFLLALIFCVSLSSQAATPRLSERKDAKNILLSVGVSDDLPGIPYDLKAIDQIASHPDYHFQNRVLAEQDATADTIVKAITQLASQVDPMGTFFFYYTGHGEPGQILVYDRPLRITEIRDAIAKGRANLPPLQRLVMMYDACYSGSFFDFYKLSLPRDRSAELAMSVESAFTSAADSPSTDYWKNLFVFASSKADELSDPGELGSAFTLALQQAFQENMSRNGTMAEWIEDTKAYTENHHPVERLIPASLYEERLF